MSIPPLTKETRPKNDAYLRSAWATDQASLTRPTGSPTLHGLRRGRNLTLSEVARLTGISTRALAAYEYEGQPLEAAERDALAALFGVRGELVASGLGMEPVQGEPRPLRMRPFYRASAWLMTALLSLSLQVPRLALAHSLSDDGALSFRPSSQVGQLDQQPMSGTPAAEPIKVTVADMHAPADAAAQSYALGTALEIDGLKVKIENAQEHPGTPAVRALDGKRFIVARLELENMTPADLPLASRLQIELRDAAGQVYEIDNLAVMAAGGRLPPESIPPLSRLLATVGYQVPQAAAGLEVRLIRMPAAAVAEPAAPAKLRVTKKVLPKPPQARKLAAQPPQNSTRVTKRAKPKAAQNPLPPSRKPGQPAAPMRTKSVDQPIEPIADLPGVPGPAQPHQCPVVKGRTAIVITQGYGVGSHAPAAMWGAIDLAPAGGPAAAQGAIVVAAHAGTVEVSLNTWPAGNHIWVDGTDGWRTGYSHLESVVIQGGQYVEAGQAIGILGSTGAAVGPHLDFQVWHNGVNVDPTPFVRCK